MASQEKQVFYVTDFGDSRWSVVLQGRTMHCTDDNFVLDISESPSLSSNMPNLDVNNEVDDIHALRDDHHEGLCEMFGDAPSGDLPPSQTFALLGKTKTKTREQLRHQEDDTDSSYRKQKLTRTDTELHSS
ncbi:hypothetical protein V8G54_004454 [Vigna mungo]|uniref:Uncharacterized protein n=1 Tax=Vigna mungo TaxID=3915 RepID=A0AAQ3PH37_VIGMU